MTTSSAPALWPDYATPDSLAAIEEVPLTARNLPTSTYAVLDRAAALWPDRTAVTFLPRAEDWENGHTRTFAELRTEVHRLVHLFRSHGIGRRESVGLLSPNTALLPTALLAAQTAAIAAPVNPHLPADHITRLLRLGRARILVAAGPELDPGTWRTALAVAAELKPIALYALRPTGATGTGPALEALGGTTVDYLDAAMATSPDERPRAEPNAHDLAALFHTGGTTGAPKLAAHTHGNEVVDAWSIAANSLLDERSVIFAGLPLFHVNALVVTLLAPCCADSTWCGQARSATGNQPYTATSGASSSATASPRCPPYPPSTPSWPRCPWTPTSAPCGSPSSAPQRCPRPSAPPSPSTPASKSAKATA